MMSITEIRKFVSDYIDRDVSGEEFGKCAVRLLYELPSNCDPAIGDLVRALNSKVAEVHVGLINDLEFRASLIPYSDKKPTVRAMASVASPPITYELLELVGY